MSSFCNDLIDKDNYFNGETGQRRPPRPDIHNTLIAECSTLFFIMLHGSQL